MKTLRVKKVAAVLMIAMMMAMAAGQAGANIVPLPGYGSLPHPSRYNESGDVPWSSLWIGIDSVLRLVV